MSKDGLTDLSALWQSEAPSVELDIQALQRRYRRQRWLMRFNVVAELLTLVCATGFVAWLFSSGAQLHTLLWASFVTLWGWVLFGPINLSRWRSLSIMKDKSLNDAINDHIKLVDQELLRWKLSLYATALLLIVFTVSGVVNLVSQHGLGIDLLIDAMLVVGLALLVGWFHRKRKASLQIRKMLSS